MLFFSDTDVETPVGQIINAVINDLSLLVFLVENTLCDIRAVNYIAIFLCKSYLNIYED
jgi:hypothetical protein